MESVALINDLSACLQQREWDRPMRTYPKRSARPLAGYEAVVDQVPAHGGPDTQSTPWKRLVDPYGGDENACKRWTTLAARGSQRDCPGSNAV